MEQVKGTVLITGVSKGIGKAITDKLLSEDYFIHGIARTNPNISHSNFKWTKVDLYSEDEIITFAKNLGIDRIDILINNAGTAYVQDSLNFNEDIFNKIFDLNFKTPILLTQNLYDKLKGGLIINISSLSDRYPENDLAIYCASKAALNIYFDSIVEKYKELKVFHVLPGYVNTPLLHSVIGDKPFDWSQCVEPEEVGEAVFELITQKDTLPNSAKLVVSKDDIGQQEKIYKYSSLSKSLVLVNHS